MHRSPRIPPRPIVGLVGLLALALTWGGCSSLPTTPDSAPPATMKGAAAPQSGALLGGLVTGLLGGGGSTQPAWSVVKSQWVDAGTEAVVQGSHYTLTFHAGSLTQGAQIQISEYDPQRLDFQLQPHGIQFGTPVDLVVDYRGTKLDPLSPNWDGSLPIFLWLDPNTHLWQVVAGLDDPVTRTYHVRLQHFSEYQLSGVRAGGTAEW